MTPCEAPATYCIAAPNSVSPSGSIIGWAGNTSVAANQFQLRAFGAPLGQFALYVYGPQPAQVPFGDGFLCLDGAAGIVRILPPFLTSSQNPYAVDFTAPQSSQGGGAILAGSTWHFQLWYRDPAAGGASFNLSNGLRVTFCH